MGLCLAGTAPVMRAQGVSEVLSGVAPDTLPRRVTSAPVALRRHPNSDATRALPAASLGPNAAAGAPRRPTASQPATGVSAPWWAPVASALLPGTGQFLLKQDRSVAYLVADGYLLVQYLVAHRDGNTDRNTYRALATDVARQPYAGTRDPGSWNYYETMETWLESGRFDRVAGGAVDPETDPETYNGHRWLQARETYWFNPDNPPPVSSPEYQRALAFYLRYAIPDELRWTWRDAQLQQDVYRQTIRNANRSYQRAVNVLGLVAMNHLASMIDAYVSVRVRRFGSVGGVSVAHIDSRVVTVGDPAEGRRSWQAGITLVR